MIKTHRQSALSSDKIDKYEYLTGKEILPSVPSQIIQQAKLIYSSLGKAFEKETETINDQGEKHIKVIQIKQEIIITAKDENGKIKKREIFETLINQNKLFCYLEIKS